jgi:ATP-binding protein involved in chromosome partitioning
MSSTTYCSNCDVRNEDCAGSCGGDGCERAPRTSEVARLPSVRHKVVVLSGKGGVGKSSVAVSLAASLRLAGKRVGLLDADLDGPSVPRLLGVDVMQAAEADGKTAPVDVAGMKVMSAGFLLRGPNDAVLWRGLMRRCFVKQCMDGTEWGELDYLIIDAPPGTGEELAAVAELLGDAAGVVVTTPQQVATADARRSIAFCSMIGIELLGVIENMSDRSSSPGGAPLSLFGAGGGEALAAELCLPFLGAIPLDPSVVTAGEQGKPFVETQPESAASQAFNNVVRAVLIANNDAADTCAPGCQRRRGARIAVPIADGTLCKHFGHSEQFAIFETGADGDELSGPVLVTSPPHGAGFLPRWLARQQVTTVIAAGMGRRARTLLAAHGIEVVLGATEGRPQELVRAFVGGCCPLAKQTAAGVR